MIQKPLGCTELAERITSICASMALYQEFILPRNSETSVYRPRWAKAIPIFAEGQKTEAVSPALSPQLCPLKTCLDPF
jgi:hypothetical protein